MAQISDREGRAWVIQATQDSRFPHWFTEMLREPLLKKVGSNIKFDVKWLRRFGYEVNNFEDTSTREHIIDQSNPRKDLKSLTFKYLPRLADYSAPHNVLVKERGGWEFIKDEEMYQYAGADAEASIAAYRGQEPALADLERPRRLLKELYEVLAGMEFNGIRVDTAENRRLNDVYTERMRETQREIEKVLGPVNLNSTTQLARALHESVPSINLRDWKAIVGPGEEPDISTCREILERESHKDPVIGLVLKHRKYRTRHSTFIKSMYDKFLVQHHGHHFLHTSYRTDLVDTFRLSSQNPNLMNLPVKDMKEPEIDIKRQFVSRFEGGKILNIDLSQIEIRYAAWVSQDRAMLDAIESGEDIHTMMAARLLSKDPGAVTPQERYECKTRTFLIMYGGGANRLMEELLKSDIAPTRVSKRQAIGMIQEYFATFSGLKAFIDATRAQVRRDLEVETAFGFRRRFVRPDFWRSGDGFRVERQAFNTLIQSGAACVTYCAMIAMQNEMDRCNMQSKMVGQVFDSVVSDVHPQEVTVMKEIVKTGMEIASVEKAKEFGVHLTVPIVADMEIGDSWGTLQEV
jgi:DNA polymerase-1